MRFDSNVVRRIWSSQSELVKDSSGKRLSLPEITCYLIIGINVALINQGISSFTTVAFGLVFLLSIFQKVDQLFWIIILVSPFSSTIRLQGSYTIEPFLILLYLGRVVFGGKIHIAKRTLIMFLATFAVNSIAAISQGNSMISVISFFVMLLFAFEVTNQNRDLDALCVKGEFLFIISVLLYCLLSELFPKAAATLSNRSEYAYRNGGFSNVWDFGRILVLAISMFVVDLRREMTLKKVIIASPCCLVMLYYLISTGLYSALVGMVAVFMFLPFTFDGSIRKRFNKILLGSIVFAFVLLVGYFLVFLPMLELRGQFTANGRSELWAMYLNHLRENTGVMLFGIGGCCIGDLATRFGTETAHNILLEKVLEFGFVGLVLLTVTLTTQYAKKYEFRVRKNYSLLIMVCFLGTCLTQGTSGSELLFLMLILSCRKKKIGLPNDRCFLELEAF